MNRIVEPKICFVDVGQIGPDDKISTCEKNYFDDVQIKEEPSEFIADYYSCRLNPNEHEDSYSTDNIEICKSEDLDIKNQPENVTEKGCFELVSVDPFITVHNSSKPPVKNRSAFTCNYCNKIFKKKRYLTRHIRIHTGEKPYVCKFCNKAFIHDHSMIRHSKIHTGERPFLCSVCEKVFISKNELRRHMFTHTGEKPYICIHCDKAFNRLSNLNSHTKIHFCSRPFKCSHCGKAFRENRYLKRHLQAGDNKPGNCKVCFAKLLSKACFNYHSIVHSLDKFLCDYCDRIFSDKSILRNHIVEHIINTNFCNEM